MFNLGRMSTGYELIRFTIEYHFLSLNPFVSNTPFLYPLKTSENRKVFLGGRDRMHWEQMG